MDRSTFTVSASIAFWCDGRILVLKRESGLEAGGWFFPGGHVEHGESPARAACRETLEETGIRVPQASLRLLDCYTLSREGVNHIGLIYLAPFPGGEVRLNEEHSGFRWMTPAAYRDRFLDLDRLRALGVPEVSVDAARELRHVVEAVIAAQQAEG